MMYGHAKIIGLGILSLLFLSIQGCSGMKWFSHGGDEQSQQRSSQEQGSKGVEPYAGGPSDDRAGAIPDRFADGTSDSRPPDSRSAESRPAGEEATQDAYPSLSLEKSQQDRALDPEGGRLSGLSAVEGDRITGEERLSRSKMGMMLHPVDRNDSLFAELRREEAAAIAAGLQDVFYAFNRWTVEDEGIQALSRDAGWLKDHPSALLRISGHCDERGSHDYNLVLGEKRARAAKNALIELGISPKQVSVVSYGKDRPFCRENDEACYQQNRRGHMLLKAR